MKGPRVPPQFVGGMADMDALFQEVGGRRGVRAEDVGPVIELIPDAIKKAPCFLDKLTRLWRYDFADPYEGLPGGSVILGTNMYQPIEQLYDVLTCARQRLTRPQLNGYLTRLSEPGKHEDTLSEFAPIVRLAPEVQTDYEVAGYGQGNRTIDWLIRPAAGTPILLDVKNRVRDLLETAVRLHAGEHDPDGSAPAPTHDPSMLFTSLEDKFLSRSPDEYVQMGWILSALMQEESELQRAFERLDPTRVHAVVLGNWGDGAYILARDDAIKGRVADVLRLRPSARFTFRRAEAARAAVARMAERAVTGPAPATRPGATEEVEA